MNSDDWQAITLTLGAASLSTLLILPLGVACSWILARTHWRGKSILETLVALPLVMPPVATGLILLNVIGRHGWLGEWFQALFGSSIVFTWRAVVLAMAVMSFPLLVRTLRVAIEEVDPRLEQVARTLGATGWRAFWTITLPLSRRGLIAGAVWAFARATGEFGATVLVAGNIPGRTTTLSVAIYSNLQLGQDEAASRLMVCSVLVAFVAILLGNRLQRGASWS